MTEHDDETRPKQILVGTITPNMEFVRPDPIIQKLDAIGLMVERILRLLESQEESDK